MNEGAHADVIEADVVIIGGGPAGCSAALALKGSGKKVLLVDKAVFPREKTCGDSIPAHALIGLENVSPGIYDSFLQKVQSVSFRSSALVFPNGSQIVFNWTLPGYIAERRIFDGFLLDRVIVTTDAQVITGLKVVDYQRVTDRQYVAISRGWKAWTHTSNLFSIIPGFSPAIFGCSR
ncbi:MAG: FAD-dependent oxidoreductase [Bacteroidales bacterium]